jgi:hypothetical protein
MSIVRGYDRILDVSLTEVHFDVDWQVQIDCALEPTDKWHTKTEANDWPLSVILLNSVQRNKNRSLPIVQKREFNDDWKPIQYTRFLFN